MTRQEKLATVDDDLVALYRETTKQSEWVVRIFLYNNVEPPTRDQWLTRGVLAAEDKLIEPFRTPVDEQVPA
jgi:hypothetical protein